MTFEVETGLDRGRGSVHLSLRGLAAPREILEADMLQDLTQVLIFALLLAAISVPLGVYMAKVAGGDYRFLDFIEKPVLALAGGRAPASHSAGAPMPMR